MSISTEVIKVQLPLVPRPGERWLALIYDKKKTLVVTRELTPDERNIVGTSVRVFCHGIRLETGDWKIKSRADYQLLRW